MSSVNKRERNNVAVLKWHVKNHDRCLEYAREKYKETSAERSIYSKKYLKNHPEKNKAKCITNLNRHLNRKLRGKLVSQNDKQAKGALTKLQS